MDSKIERSRIVRGKEVAGIVHDPIRVRPTIINVTLRSIRLHLHLTTVV